MTSFGLFEQMWALALNKLTLVLLEIHSDLPRGRKKNGSEKIILVRQEIEMGNFSSNMTNWLL